MEALELKSGPRTGSRTGACGRRAVDAALAVEVNAGSDNAGPEKGEW
jgi:hypothetical protein